MARKTGKVVGALRGTKVKIREVNEPDDKGWESDKITPAQMNRFLKSLEKLIENEKPIPYEKARKKLGLK